MPGKHDPVQPHTYFAVHETFLQQRIDSGAIVKLDLREEVIGPLLYIYGHIFLRGNLVLDVNKALEITRHNGRYFIQTIKYSYNLSLPEGNVFRFDNSHPHEGHSSPHHFHRFDPPGVEVSGSPFEIIGENWPTLGQAIDDADMYYWEHIYPQSYR